MQHIFIVILCSLFCFGSQPLFSEEAAPPSSQAPLEKEFTPQKNLPTHSLPPQETHEFNFGEEFFKMLLILAAIIGLLLFSAWFLKRLMQQRVKQMNQSSHIKILERRILNQKTMIYLIEVEERHIVVGESPSGLTTLSEFTPSRNNSSTEKEDRLKPPASFGEILQRKIKDRP